MKVRGRIVLVFAHGEGESIPLKTIKQVRQHIFDQKKIVPTRILLDQGTAKSEEAPNLVYLAKRIRRTQSIVWVTK